MYISLEYGAQYAREANLQSRCDCEFAGGRYSTVLSDVSVDSSGKVKLVQHERLGSWVAVFSPCLAQHPYDCHHCGYFKPVVLK